jgi:hypothetical protein
MKKRNKGYNLKILGFLKIKDIKKMNLMISE